MKKLLSVILVLSMILGSVSSVGVFALDEDVAISLVAKEAEYVEGTPSTLAAVELSENPGISNLMLVVYYKADELKLSESTEKSLENSIFAKGESYVSSEMAGTGRAIKNYLPEGAVASEYKGFTVDLCSEWNSEAGAYEDMTADGIVIEIPFEAASFVAGAEYKYTVVVTGAENGAGVSYDPEGLSFEGSVMCVADEELGKYSDFTLFLSPETVKIESRKEDTFKVDLRVDANPGIWNMRFYLVYPEETALKSIENGTVFPDDTFSTLYKNRPLSDPEQLDTFKKAIAGERIPQIGYASAGVNYKFSAADKVANGNGVLLTLEFEMPKNASYEELFDIRVLYAEGDIYGPPASSGFENFAPEAVGTKVTVGCDHAETVEGYKEPTCGADGYNGTVCAFCNKLYSGEILPATEEHTPGELNCLEGQYCLECKKMIIPPVDAHVPGPWGGCMSPSICSVCNAVIEEAPGHVFANSGECKVCGGFSTKHPYTSQAYDVYIFRSGAESITITFSEKSYTDYSDDVYVYDMGGNCVAIYSLGEMASESLTVYGEGVRISFSPRYPNKYYGFDIENVAWKYPEFCGDYGYREINSGEEIEIVSCVITEGVVSIPSEINGKPVTKIGRNAFAGKTGITKIEIPETVTEIDTGAFSGCTSLTDVYIPGNVRTVGNRAFYNCSSLTDVYIPGNVRTVGDRAFYNCSSLLGVIIAEGVTSIGYDAFPEVKVILFPKTLESLHRFAEPEHILFSGTKDEWKFDSVFVEYDELGDKIYPEVYCNCVYGNDGIVYQYVSSSTASALCYPGDETEVHIRPEIEAHEVTSIGLNNFALQKKIEKLHIPSSIRSIAEDAFKDCTALSGVYIEDVAAWCNISFGYNYSNPLMYAKNLYLDGELVTHLVIPEGVSSVKQKAFQGCTSIREVVIPEGVTHIGYRAFYGCSGIQSVIMPASVKNPLSHIVSIGEYAFYGCTGIETVYYPNDKEDWLAINVQYGNTCLTDATIVCHYGTPLAGFSFVTNDSNNTITITGYESDSTDMVIPSSYNGYIVRYMDFYAFEGREDITSVVIPETMWVIPEGAFKDCKNLERVTIKEGVRDIGDYAFSGCTSLTEVVIPEGVEYIFTYAFNECTSLQSVSLPYTLMTIEYKAFYMCDAIDRVTYNGSEERWNNITVASGNAALERAGIVFAETPDTGDNEVRFSAVGELSEGGDTVTVKVYVDENPGTWCMRFNVNYNSEYFTLLSAENGEVYLDSETAGRNLGGYYLYYAENTDVYENNSKTGLILTLTFAVAEGIPGGEYSFNVDFPDDVESWFFDVNTLRGRTVSCTSQAQVTVEGEETVIPGDLSGDGEINAKDANLIKQIIAGESPAAGEALAFADLNGDGVLNAKDANLMKQLIAGEIQI
ncbi:MAG: leucine-rich repeat protein [Clostridia bacterium]|nr:leucine-rich repeat protein [Clostridia bacterium]